MSGKGGKADTAAMYNELNRFQQCEEYEKAVKVCNKILNSSPKVGKLIQRTFQKTHSYR